MISQVKLLKYLPLNFDKLADNAHAGTDAFRTIKSMEEREHILDLLEKAVIYNQTHKTSKINLNKLVAEFTHVLKQRAKCIRSLGVDKHDKFTEKSARVYCNYIAQVRVFDRHVKAVFRTKNNEEDHIMKGDPLELQRLREKLALYSIYLRKAKEHKEAGTIPNPEDNPIEHRVMVKNKEIYTQTILKTILRAKRQLHLYEMRQQLGTMQFTTPYFELTFDYPLNKIFVKCNSNMAFKFFQKWTKNFITGIISSSINDRNIELVKVFYKKINGEEFKFPEKYYATIESFGEFVQLTSLDESLRAKLSRVTFVLQFETEVPAHIRQSHKIGSRRNDKKFTSMKEANEFFHKICAEMGKATNYEYHY